MSVERGISKIGVRTAVAVVYITLLIGIRKWIRLVILNSWILKNKSGKPINIGRKRTFFFFFANNLLHNTYVLN